MKMVEYIGNWFGPLVVVLIGVMPVGAQFNGSASDLNLVLNSISPNSIDCDVDLVGSASFTVQFTHSYRFTPSLDNYTWLWECNGQYWNGQAWTSTPVWAPINSNADAFWAPSSVPTSSSAVFSLPRSSFPEEFWSIAGGGQESDIQPGGASLSVNVQMAYSKTYGSDISNVLSVEFHRPNPAISVDAAWPQTLTINPAQTTNWHFEVPYQITHVANPDSANIVWSWRDSATGLYWNGTAWTSQPYQEYPASSSGGFWQLSAVTSSNITMDIPTDQFTEAFWSGSQKQIQLVVGYQHNGPIFWTEIPSQILIQLNEKLVLNQVDPSVVEADPDSGTNVLTNFLFDHWCYETQNLNNYSWQWKIGSYFNYKYWDGISWTTTPSWHPIHVNSNPFWGLSYMTNQQKAVFSLMPGNFPQAFWDEAQDTGSGSDSISVSICLRYTGVGSSQTSAFKTLELTKPQPTVSVSSVQPPSLVVDPGQSSSLHLDVPFSISHVSSIENSNVVWSWKDASTQQYWNGSTWAQEESLIYPAAENDGFWERTGLNGSSISLDVTESQFGPAFWTGSVVDVQVQVGYMHKGQVIWAPTAASLQVQHIEELETLNILPEFLDGDPELGDTVSFTVQFKHWSTTTPDLDRYSWTWETNGYFWDGQTWTLTPTWESIHNNPVAFWEPSFVSDGSATFTLERNQIPDDFWNGSSLGMADDVSGQTEIRELTVDLTLRYETSPGEYLTGETVTEHFSNQNPALSVFEPLPRNLWVDLGQTSAFHIEVPFHVGHLTSPDLSAISWCWKDIETGLYWDGATWVSEVSVQNPNNPPRFGFWRTTQVDSNSISINLYNYNFSQEFWNGSDKQIQIRVGYQWQNTTMWQAIPNPFAIKLLAPHAPMSVSPEGEIVSSSATLSWPEVAGADSYRVALMKPDATMLDPNWQDSAVATTNYTTPILSPNLTYRVFVYGYNRAGLSSHALQSTLVYKKSAPILPTTITPMGSTVEVNPTFSWDPIESADSYLLGLKDPQGNWLESGWENSPIITNYYTLGVPLELGVTYDIYLGAKNEIGESIQRVGQISLATSFRTMEIREVNEQTEAVVLEVDPENNSSFPKLIVKSVTPGHFNTNPAKNFFSWKLRGTDPEKPVYWNGVKWVESIDPVWICIYQIQLHPDQYPFFTDGFGLKVIYFPCPTPGPECLQDWEYRFQWDSFQSLAAFSSFWGCSPEGVDIQLAYLDGENLTKSNVFPVQFEYPNYIPVYTQPRLRVESGATDFLISFDSLGHDDPAQWQMAWMDADRDQGESPRYWDGAAWVPESSAIWSSLSNNQSFGYNQTVQMRGNQSNVNVAIQSSESLLTDAGRPSRKVRVLLRWTGDSSLTLVSSSNHVTEFYQQNAFPDSLVQVSHFGHLALDSSLGRVVPDLALQLESGHFQHQEVVQGETYDQLFLNMTVVRDDGEIMPIGHLTEALNTLSLNGTTLEDWFGTDAFEHSDNAYYLFAYLSKDSAGGIGYELPPGSDFDVTVEGQSVFLGSRTPDEIRQNGFPFHFRDKSELDGTDLTIKIRDRDKNGQIIDGSEGLRNFLDWRTIPGDPDRIEYAANVGDLLEDQTAYGLPTYRFGWQVYGNDANALPVGQPLTQFVGDQQGQRIELIPSMVPPENESISILRSVYDAYGIPMEQRYVVSSLRDFSPTRNYLHLKFFGGDNPGEGYPDNSQSIVASGQGTTLAYSCFSSTYRGAFQIDVLGLTDANVFGEGGGIPDLSMDLRFKYRREGHLFGPWQTGDSSDWSWGGIDQQIVDFGEGGLPLNLETISSLGLDRIYNSYSGNVHNFYGASEKGAIIQLMNMTDTRSGKTYQMNSNVNQTNFGNFTVQLKYNGPPITLPSIKSPCDEVPLRMDFTNDEFGWPLQEEVGSVICQWYLDDFCGPAESFTMNYELRPGDMDPFLLTPLFRDIDLELYENRFPSSSGYEWYLEARFKPHQGGAPRYRIKRLNNFNPQSGVPIQVDFDDWVDPSGRLCYWDSFFYTLHWTCKNPSTHTAPLNAQGDPSIASEWMPGFSCNVSFRLVKKTPLQGTLDQPELCKTNYERTITFDAEGSFQPLQRMDITPNLPTCEISETTSGLPLKFTITPTPLHPNPYFTEPFVWKWEDLDTSLQWNGSEWGSAIGFRQLSQGLNGFFSNCSSSLVTLPEIVAPIEQNKFNENFWLGRNQVNVKISVLNGSIESACVVAFVKPGVVPEDLTGFDLSVSPTDLEVDPSQTDPIQFALMMNNLDPQNVILDDSKISWRWKKSDGSYWNGMNWVTSGAGYDQFYTPSEGPFGNSDTSLSPPGIQAQIAQNLFSAGFWGQVSSVDCTIELQYLNPNSPPVSSPCTNITFHQPFDGSIQYPQTTNSRSELPELNELGDLLILPETNGRQVYAPEPVLLKPNGLTDYVHDRYWVLGDFDAADLDVEDSDLSLPATPLDDSATYSRLGYSGTAVHIYQWLEIPFNPATPDLTSNQVFIIPHNESLDSTNAPFIWDDRQSVSLDGKRAFANWQFEQNVAYRYVGDQFQIAIFVPAKYLAKGHSAHNPVGDSGTQQITDQEFENWLAQPAPTDPSQPKHNRLLTVNYLAGGRKAYSLAFTDLLGRAQEVRTIGSYYPSLELQNQVLVSGVTEFDALGRPIKNAKPFYTDLGTNFYTTGTRGATFDDATDFWQAVPKIGGLTYVESNSSDVAYSETYYETDPRGRVVAQFPMGRYGNKDNKLADLRYPRFHYFVVKPPTLNGGLDGLNNLPFMIIPDSANPDTPLYQGPCLQGTLAVDPEGGVVATFTGNDTETPLITVTNPSPELMDAWGLVVVTTPPTGPEDLDALTVYLPSDYETRLQNENHADGEAEGFSANLATYSELDSYGRLINSYPPRALVVESTATDAWTLSLQAAESGLATHYEYDQFDRVIAVHEPDAGTTTNKYNQVGWLRFSQNDEQLNASPWRWTEFIYDDVGRLIQTRDITFNADPTTHWDAYVEARNADGVATPVPFSQLYVDFDYYDSAHASFPWPTQDALQSEYETIWPSAASWSNGYGLPTQTSSHNSAERVYYDDRGLVLARVRFIEGINEPHITMFRYDGFDGKLTEVKDLYTDMHYGYVYDAWDRLVDVYDLRPCTWRMRLGVAFQARSTSQSTVPDKVTTYLGSLLDTTMIHGSPDNQEPMLLEHYVHTPTGHVAKVDVASLFSESFKYDIRDFVLEKGFQTQGVGLFTQQFRYEESIYADSKTYGGNIGEVDDLYGGVTGTPPRTIPHQFQYDLLSQLLESHVVWDDSSEITNSYAYDKNGNRLEETRNNVPVEGQPNGENWVLTHSIPSGTNRLGNVQRFKNELWTPYYEIDPEVDYDSLGNLNGYTSYSSGNQRDFALTYGDPRFPILPTAIQVDTNDIVTEEYAYDFSGTRVKREIWTDEDGDGEVETDDVTYFIPFGTENQAELDAYGRVKRAYIFAGSERIGYRGGGDTFVYVKDYLGSTRLTLALNQPSIQDAIRQSAGDNGPYGNTWNEIYLNGGEKEPHQFTGQENEAELGLYYMGARFYDPDLGRFLQVDPKRQFWNSYSYVGNNPVMGTDPTGMATPYEYHYQLAAEHSSKGEHIRGLSHYFLAQVSRWTGYDLFVKPIDSLIWKGETNSTEVINSVGTVLSFGLGRLAFGLRSGSSNAVTYADDAENAIVEATESVLHKNNNAYVGHQAVYEIRISGELFKYGKADMTNMASSGLPRRLQSQLNQLGKKFDDVAGEVLYENKMISTKLIKEIETKYIQQYYDLFEALPKGNPKHPGIVK